MKRFCLDFSIVLMALGFLLCLMAIPTGEISRMLVLPTMLCLACGICIAYQQSVRLEKRALRAKYAAHRRAVLAHRRAVLAHRRAALVRANAMQLATQHPQSEGGLYVA